jgi:hypothetical protein
MTILSSRGDGTGRRMRIGTVGTPPRRADVVVLTEKLLATV